jgi:hypothetical protein
MTACLDNTLFSVAGLSFALAVSFVIVYVTVKSTR